MFKILITALMTIALCSMANVSAYDDSPDPRMRKPGTEQFKKHKPSSLDKWMKAQREERKPANKAESTR